MGSGAHKSSLRHQSLNGGDFSYNSNVGFPHMGTVGAVAITECFLESERVQMTVLLSRVSYWCLEIRLAVPIKMMLFWWQMTPLFVLFYL